MSLIPALRAACLATMLCCSASSVHSAAPATQPHQSIFDFGRDSPSSGGDSGRTTTRPVNPPAVKAPPTTVPVPRAHVPDAEGQPVPPAGEWIDLLAQLKPDAFPDGWACHSGVLANKAKDDRPCMKIALPTAAKGSYDLEVTFVRLGGSNDVDFILPVGAGQTMLMLSGWSGKAGGLDRINGRRPDKNPSTFSPSTLVNDQAYKLSVRVRLKGADATITAQLDDVNIVNWTGPQSALTLAKTWKIPPDRIGLGAYKSDASFQGVRTRAIADQTATGETPPPQ